jgi:TetR/AcrR family transcriptional repressor of bet genes
MAREGYDGASVAAIAREAGVAAGGVHYHFASKAEILVDLVERLVVVAEQRVDDRVARARDGRGRLAAILDGLLALDATADPAAIATWSLVGAEAVRNEEVRAVYAAWVTRARDRLRDAFAAACREEGRSARGATEAAGALVALVEGFFAVAAGAPSAIAPGSAAPAARRLAFALLDAQPERRG